MSDSLKLLLVSDIHHNPVDAPPKLCSQGRLLLARVVQESAAGNYDLLIDLGDRIDERNPQDDIALAHEVSGIFRQAPCERIHLMGNHDSYFLNNDTCSDILGVPVRSRVADIKGYRLIFFCPDVDNRRGQFDYQLTDAELDWLRDALRTELRTVIFSHVPLLAGPLFGNYYFEGKRGRAEFLNAAAARAMIAESNTILAVAAHVHWNTWHCVDGVHYVTVQSLTESFTTHPMAAGAFTILDIGDEIIIDVRGHDRMRLRLAIRDGKRRWLTSK